MNCKITLIIKDDKIVDIFSEECFVNNFIVDYIMNEYKNGTLKNIINVFDSNFNNMKVSLILSFNEDGSIKILGLSKGV